MEFSGYDCTMGLLRYFSFLFSFGIDSRSMGRCKSYKSASFKWVWLFSHSVRSLNSLSLVKPLFFCSYFFFLFILYWNFAIGFNILLTSQQPNSRSNSQSSNEWHSIHTLSIIYGFYVLYNIELPCDQITAQTISTNGKWR